MAQFINKTLQEQIETTFNVNTKPLLDKLLHSTDWDNKLTVLQLFSNVSYLVYSSIMCQYRLKLSNLFQTLCIILPLLCMRCIMLRMAKLRVYDGALRALKLCFLCKGTEISPATSDTCLPKTHLSICSFNNRVATTPLQRHLKRTWLC